MIKLKIEEGPLCTCVVTNRKENESQRDWLKRFMCMHHWMETDYYRRKANLNKMMENAKNTTSE